MGVNTKGFFEPSRLLAIGGGLALGHEGPSVQMGATATNMIGRLLRLGPADCRSLLAAGDGAGLATAFNAPGAGAIFVLGEQVGKFEARPYFLVWVSLTISVLYAFG